MSNKDSSHNNEVRLSLDNPIGGIGREIYGLNRSDFSQNPNANGFYYSRDAREGLPELLKSWEGKIHLIYLDPPYLTGKKFMYSQKISSEDSQAIIKHHAYTDQWQGGREEYLIMMKQVLYSCYQLLSEEGSIYVHSDYRTSPYLRVMMDEMFGEENFLNEIIWHYNSGGRAKKHFSRKHDNILFYRKSKNYYFNLEEVGSPRGTSKRNNMKKQVDEDGRIFWSIKSGGKEYRYFEDAKVYPSDVWDDISHLQQKDPERTGYDTQKPQALLERIIKVSSRPGDIVADFFAGSGTTLAVAQKLNRNWIGMDNGIFSLHTCRKRLLSSLGNKSMLISSDINIISNNYSDIVDISMQISDDNYLKVILNSYKAIPDTRGLKYDETLRYIDYWSVGTIKDSYFIPTVWSLNSKENLTVNSSLTLSFSGDKEIAIQIIDVFGKQHLLVLPIPKK